MITSYAAQVGFYLWRDYGLKADEIDSSWLSEQICQCWIRDDTAATCAFIVTNARQRKAS